MNKLNFKEKQYLKKLFSSDTNLDLTVIMEVLNKKRGAAGKLSLDIGVISDFINDLEKSSTADDKNSKKKSASTLKKQKTSTLKKQKKRADEIKLVEEHEKSAEHATFITASVLDNLRSHFVRLLSPSRPKRYMIVSGKTQAYLQTEVNKYMKAGWQPFGGVGAAAFGISPVAGNQYIQAMVKY